MHLLVQIYRRHNRWEELLALMNSATYGRSSKIAMGDWSFVTAELEALKELQKWDDLWRFCHDLLEQAYYDEMQNTRGVIGPGDDWLVWNHLLVSTKELS